MLDKASKIVNYVWDLCYYIDGVTITRVYEHGFSFKVKVPRWFKLVLSQYLRKRIQKKVGEQMVPGVTFDFTIYSEDWF